MPTTAFEEMFSRKELKDIGRKLCKMSSNKRTKKSIVECLVNVNKELNQIYNQYRKYRDRPLVEIPFPIDEELLSGLNFQELKYIYKLYRNMCKGCNGRTKGECSIHIQWLMRYAKEFDIITNNKS